MVMVRGGLRWRGEERGETGMVLRHLHPASPSFLSSISSFFWGGGGNGKGRRGGMRLIMAFGLGIEGGWDGMGRRGGKGRRDLMGV